MTENDMRVLDAYRQLNKDMIERLIYLALAMIGAILFMCGSYGVDIWKLGAFLLLCSSIAVNVFYYICSLMHYEAYMRGYTKSIDYNESIWGKLARVMRWIFIGLFGISSIVFIIALFIQALALKNHI